MRGSLKSGDAERWADVLSAFDDLVELDATARAERLAAIGATDPARRRALDELFAADAHVETRLERIESALVSHTDSGTTTRHLDRLGLTGRTIGHFRVIEPLAHGGMGAVYRAEDTQLQRRVALKFPLQVQPLDRATKERFLREARAAGSLDHPNLCAIHEAGEVDGLLFIAMPLYPGETLKERLSRQRVLPIADALAIARQIAQGLGAAHGAGLVHRDLKPANVMILRDGTVKILDFGLAKTADPAITTTRVLLGTASYMAPEQVQGNHLDGRTDLWALGVLLYEMLTGRRPFEGEHDVSIGYAILHDEPTPPAMFRPEITPQLQQVMQRLLLKDATERYARADDVTADLAALEGGSTPERRTQRRVVFRFDRRVAATLAIVVGAAAGIALGASMLRRGDGVVADPRTIVVMPFDVDSADAETRHLSAGISDAIGTELSRLERVIVPGHVSIANVLREHATPEEAARALEADAFMIGTLRRTGGRIVIDAVLRDAVTNERLWTTRLERAATDVRDVPGIAARAIVDALDIAATDAEEAVLQRLPTIDARAYDLYLRGRAIELASRPRRGSDRLPVESVRRAQSFYSRARELDPGFARARGRLALMHMGSAAEYDTTAARREQARIEAEAALRVEPGLAAAHEALALYWQASNDPEKSIGELKLALASAPNSAELRSSLGTTYTAAGRFDDALAELELAMQLDPSNPDRAFNVAVFALRARRDQLAMQAFDRAVALAPDYHAVKVIRGHTFLRAFGVPDTLEALMRMLPPEWDPDGMATWARYSVLRVQRRYRAALAMLDSSSARLSRDGLVYHPMSLMRAELHEALGEGARARSFFEVARRELQDSVAANPDDASIRISLALALAGLGRKQEAAREARRALDLAPLSKSNPQATAFMGGAVEVFGRIGDLDAAFELIELLLSMPAGREVTVPWLRISPTFDPLRTDPRFEELITRFSG